MSDNLAPASCGDDRMVKVPSHFATNLRRASEREPDRLMAAGLAGSANMLDRQEARIAQLETRADEMEAVLRKIVVGGYRQGANGYVINQSIMDASVAIITKLDAARASK